MANLKGILKAAIAGATIVGGAILGLEAKKSFKKPVSDTEFDDAVDATDAMLDELENLEAEDPAEEADADDEPAEAED